MKIIYFNNCWFTNVGEAFIDIGGMEICKKIFQNCQICCMSAMSDWYARHAKYSNYIKQKWSRLFREHTPKDVADMSMLLDADYVIMPGMMGTMEYLEGPERIMVDNLVSRGCKVIFLGLGFEKYTNEEIEHFSRYIETLKTAIIISRDKVAYEAMKSVTPCICGIDCAFWVKDNFNPSGFSRMEYDIVTFNRTTQPDTFSNWDVPIIFPEHMQYSYTSEKFKNRILISDTPYDYLTAYANARRVYTDLVHATITSLMYGVPVKYYYVDKRSLAFTALDNLVDKAGWLSVNPVSLEMQKRRIIKEIQETLVTA